MNCFRAVIGMGFSISFALNGGSRCCLVVQDKRRSDISAYGYEEALK